MNCSDITLTDEYSDIVSFYKNFSGLVKVFANFANIDI